MSLNVKLKGLDFGNNNFKTGGMIQIAKALCNVSNFAIDNNSVGEKAADDIATVLSHNTNLQGLDIGNNSFKTKVMMKLVKALQFTSTLTVFRIINNDVGEEAANDIVTVLSHSTNLQKLYLHDNRFTVVGMKIIAGVLQSISTLRVFNISQNFIW